eukprot:CAMPEP_0116899682 /NCGR_PEP_ID=MMETSP0467-20121206/8193_1 /TAXON_ID=283647 /ORGANISM="Mesodinium pulex, Strain SPMC105" /LENGTH=66 /DNA_ID=CAMNT_0004572631 /DNA_START=1541 /DNA_END=1741 /DNA_ORIENTATION=-
MDLVPKLKVLSAEDRQSFRQARTSSLLQINIFNKLRQDSDSFGALGDILKAYMGPDSELPDVIDNE